MFGSYIAYFPSLLLVTNFLVSIQSMEMNFLALAGVMAEALC
jgi:hypothetical protein